MRRPELFKPNVTVLAALCAAGFSLPAAAQSAEDDVAALKRQVDAMSGRLAELEAAKASAASAPEKKADDAGKAIKLYGQLRLSVDDYSEDFGSGESGTTVKSNASRFGIHGEIPTSLSGTSMIYRAEVLYGAADNVSAEIAWREGFAGLKGGWGQARLGRIDVPYKTTLTAIDPWNDNAPQSRGFGGRQGSSALHSSYFTNTAQYITPGFFGVKLGGWWSGQLDGETSSVHDAGPINNYQGGEAHGVGLKFNQGAWYAGVDWIEIDADRIGSVSGGTFTANPRMQNDSGWQAAARYKGAAWSVAAFYEDVEDLGLGTNAYVNTTYKIGATTLIATYGQNRDATQYFNRAIDTWSVGAKYALTKDSELFAAWVDRSEDAFVNGGGTPVAAKDFQILSVGLNVKFGY